MVYVSVYITRADVSGLLQQLYLHIPRTQRALGNRGETLVKELKCEKVCPFLAEHASGSTYGVCMQRLRSSIASVSSQRSPDVGAKWGTRECLLSEFKVCGTLGVCS